MNRLQASRFDEVVRIFEKYGFGQFFGGKRTKSESLKESPEKRLRKALEHLGGGFKLAKEKLNELILSFGLNDSTIIEAKMIIEMNE